jgi:FMN phosphatase YigB (HAD superfamily)
MPNIRHVIFDMDGVLAHYDFDRRMAEMARLTGLAAADIDAAIFKSGFDEEADRGEHDAEQYLAGMAERLGTAVTAADWVAARRLSMTPNEPVLQMARDLAGRVGIAMLTNNGPLLLRHIDEVFPPAREIFGARMFFSCQFGCGKEGLAVFGLLLDRLGWRAGQTLFIDDGADYIANAETAGLNTHHFAAADRLRADLQGFGLL